MRKVRIMLVIIAVLGVVGGAMAFKAKRFGGDSYCTTVINGTSCTVSLLNAKLVAGENIKYVKTVSPTLCNVNKPACTSVGIPVQ